ncbi:MAG TPA: helix-turn-helix domain-containing protein [Anaeromyxobacteraceae bacterium]|nr:helix-turn-helix domain-containing protein [Anaeromyxobacteraceae bacterium]
MDTAERDFAEAIRTAVSHYLEGRGTSGAALLAGMNHRPLPGGWLTVEDTVAYLGLRSRMALYQAVRRGQIPAHRFGRRLRFRKTELDAALAGR